MHCIGKIGHLSETKAIIAIVKILKTPKTFITVDNDVFTALTV